MKDSTSSWLKLSTWSSRIQRLTCLCCCCFFFSILTSFALRPFFPSPSYFVSFLFSVFRWIVFRVVYSRPFACNFFRSNSVWMESPQPPTAHIRWRRRWPCIFIRFESAKPYNVRSNDNVYFSFIATFVHQIVFTVSQHIRQQTHWVTKLPAEFYRRNERIDSHAINDFNAVNRMFHPKSNFHKVFRSSFSIGIWHRGNYPSLRKTHYRRTSEHTKSFFYNLNSPRCPSNQPTSHSASHKWWCETREREIAEIYNINLSMNRAMDFVREEYQSTLTHGRRWRSEWSVFRLTVNVHAHRSHHIHSFVCASNSIPSYVQQLIYSNGLEWKNKTKTIYFLFRRVRPELSSLVNKYSIWSSVGLLSSVNIRIR